MYKQKRILAIIPARGGSKGIKDKNIMDINGLPLIAYSIIEGKKSKYIDKLIVSTDSEKIAEISKQYGALVPFIRPAELSSDTAKSVDVVLHGLEYLEDMGETYDYVVLLQPTSPLRTCNDIDSAVEKLAESGRDSLVSMCEAENNPFLMRTINNDRLSEVVKYDGSLRRQDLPHFYVFNGAIYITSAEMLKSERKFVDEDTLPYIMSSEKSIDIDTIFDAKVVEMCIKESIDVQYRR